MKAWRHERARWGVLPLTSHRTTPEHEREQGSGTAAVDGGSVLGLLAGGLDALVPGPAVRAELTRSGEARTGALPGGHWRQRFQVRTLLGGAADRELVEAEVEALSVMLQGRPTPRVPGRPAAGLPQVDPLVLRTAAVAVEALLVRAASHQRR